MRTWTLATIMILCVLSGCGLGPTYREFSPTLAAVPPGDGRMFFYRTSIFGATLQPSILVNGEKVGTSSAGGFFYIDRPAGEYTIHTSNSKNRALTIVLDSGEVYFVRFRAAFPATVYPELVDAETAEEEIANCNYTPPK